MKINKVLFIISTICIFAFIGCEKILDLKPKDVFSETDVFSDINLVELLLTHTYNCTASWGIDVQNWWGERMGIENACDEGYFHWNPSIYTIDIGIITPDGMGMFSHLWKQKYGFIREANVFLSKIDESEVKKINPIKVEELKGEMKYLRASVYFDLINYFGGVPITDKPFELTDESFSIPRNSYKDCVNFIVNDLDEAKDMVPQIRPANEFGKVTKGACLALKSRVLLYAASELHDPSTGSRPNGPLYDYDNDNKWKDAADAAKALIDLNQYSLVVVGSWEDYQKMFLHPNPEIIFARPFHPDWGNVGNDFTTLPDKAHSPNGYNGWSCCSPTQNLVWSFKMANGKRINEAGSNYNPENPYVNRDPRFYADIVFNGCMYRGRNAEFYLPGGLDSRDGIMNFHYNVTGYNLRKFMDESIDIDKEASPNRPYIISRLAEIYLNYAEAQYHLGNEDIAREYVNKVANRVSMPEIQTSGEELLMDIKNERQIELCFEGHRFFDARRWMSVSDLSGICFGIEWKKVDTNGNLSPDGILEQNIITVEERILNPGNYYLPIPRSEIEKSGIEQNFGYN